MIDKNKINELLLALHNCHIGMEDAVYERKNGLFDIEYGEDEQAILYRKYEKTYKNCFSDIRKELDITQ